MMFVIVCHGQANMAGVTRVGGPIQHLRCHFGRRGPEQRTISGEEAGLVARP